MATRTLVTLLISLVALPVARADIVEWQDAQGVRHFTNSKDDVPGGEPARVVIAEHTAPAATTSVAPEPASEPPRQAQVVYDYSQVTDAYLAGLQEGLSLAGRNPTETINQPVAIAGARGNDSWYPYYEPLVTTSFDHGRSRHRTLRMLLEAQFQLDRDGPFVVERLPPGLGPNLNPFLPRGLPQGFPVGLRVLFH